MARSRIRRWLAGGLVLWLAVPGGGAEEAVMAPVGLRHAVACAPFKGDSPLAETYHAILVEMLKGADNIEYLEGKQATARRAPEFIFRIHGAVEEDEEGQLFVTVTLEDAARKEVLASHVAPASDDPVALAAWQKTIQASMERRAAKLPFECRLRRQRGQGSLSIDRGLSSGLQPGMQLYVSMDEEPILSQMTGEVIGRESSRPFGEIQVFRVMANKAYARPVEGTKIPRHSRLFAWTFN